MIMAGFTDVWATFRVFRGIEVAEVLKLVILFHVVKDRLTLPVSCFEIAMFWALLGDLDFTVLCAKLGINFFLAFRTDAFGFTQNSSTPAIASIINANISSIIVMVTMRSYLRIPATVEADVNKRIAE